MKANWKFALMCFAALAFVACDNKPVDPDKPDKPDKPVEPEEFVSKISVTDNSLDDWNNVPATFVVSAECPEDAAQLGLKSVKVYADKVYINIIAEYNEDDVTDLASVPFHVYLDADNSDNTGGYGDEFADANAEWSLEGPVFADGAPYSYNPGVFKWWGAVGDDGWSWTDPSVEHSADDGWGAIVAEGALPVGASQCIGTKIEIQIMRELIPATWAETFGIGFDIQQNWSSVGILPQGAAVDGAMTKLPKLKVKIDNAD